MEDHNPRLLDQVRVVLRRRHYSIRTEQAYVDWIKRYIWFHGERHPATMAALEVEAFLTDLAVKRKVAASTQNQALSALLFLYREVLGAALPWLDNVVRAKRPKRLPVVLTVEEVSAVLERVEGTTGLMLHLLYGTGMRVMDFARHKLLIREGKGFKDRVTMLPAILTAPFVDALLVEPSLTN